MIDYQARFSTSQQVDYGTDVASTNTIDLVTLGFNYGAEVPIWVNIEATDANITALTVQIRTCDTEGGSYLSKATHVISAGTSVPVGRYPCGSLCVNALNRYVQLYYDITGATSGHLHVSAGVGLTYQTNATQG